MINREKLTILLVIIIFTIGFLYLKENMPQPVSTPPVETVKGTENPYLGTCQDSKGILIDCKKGA